LADGFALIKFNLEGKGELHDLFYFDFRLQDIDFDATEGLNQLIEQLPEGINDVLAMVLFNYKSNCTQDYFGDWDCDETFTVLSHNIVKTNYKEFWRELVTEELKYKDSSLEDERYFNNLVGEWEEFYDEDFTPFERKAINTNIGFI
jgi:hypothetical protein